jgi:hypothetical protein
MSNLMLDGSTKYQIPAKYHIFSSFFKDKIGPGTRLTTITTRVVLIVQIILVSLFTLLQENDC